MGDGAEAVDHEPDELSGYEPESDVNTMTVPVLYLVTLFCTPYRLCSLHVVAFLQLHSHIPDNNWSVYLDLVDWSIVRDGADCLITRKSVTVSYI